MTDTFVDRLEVFFINDATGWAAARFDDAGNQLGDAVFAFHRADAIREAQAMAGPAGIDTPIIVFRKDGTRAGRA